MSPEDPYTVVAKLGEGGMAEVFKALKRGPEGFEKPVALKRILPFYADHPTFVRMLAAEARLHARLDHPNVVQLLDFFEMGGNHFIALEYVPGKNLRQIANDARDRGRVLPWELAVHIVTEVLKGLDFAHKRNGPDGPLRIVHRDVSPQNILISYEGIVKLSDFGIARARMEREETSAGVRKGKERYAAPEQLLPGEIDGRADLFSAGVVLRELLPENAPRTLTKVIERALQRNPADRFRDAAEFRERLLATQNPTWLPSATEGLRDWMEELYPRPVDREDPPLGETPLLPLIEPAQSLISAGAHVVPHRRKRLRLAGLLAALAASVALYWGLRTSEPGTPEAPAPATREHHGALRVEGAAGTAVFLNGRQVGRLPLEDLPVVPGPYVVLLKGSRGKSMMRRVTVSEDDTELVRWDESDAR